jgi:ABC-type transport system involved in cytochrome bd biosynthesis fused ATPase/permease subunit
LQKKQLNNWAKYSAMGLQMGGIIFLLTWLGIKLDFGLHLKFPIFTMLLSMFSAFAAIYYFIKDFLPKK